MRIANFVYNSEKGVKERYVAVNSDTSYQVSGLDLLDENTYKNFNRSKIRNFRYVSEDIPQEILNSGKLVTQDELLKSLGYGQPEINVFKELKTNSATILTLCKNKTNKLIIPINNYYLVNDNDFIKFSVRINNKDFTFHVDQNNIHVYFNNIELTPQQFITKVRS